MFTLKDAHAEYLPEINYCECDLCLAIAYTTNRFNLYGQNPNSAAGVERYAAISARLKALVEGTHIHKTLQEKAQEVRDLKIANGEDLNARGYVKVSMRDFYATGMGLGIGPRNFD